MDRDKILYLLDQLTFISLCLMVFFLGFSKAGIEIFFGFAFSGFVVKKILLRTSWKKLFSSEGFNLPLFIFICANALSLINSKEYFWKSLHALIAKWLEYILIFYLSIDTINTKKKLNIFILICLFSSALIGVDTIFQKIIGFDFLRHKPLVIVQQNNIPAVTGSFVHYNDLSAYLITFLPLILCLLFSSAFRKKLVRFFIGVEALLIFICLILAFSRGGWLGFIVSLVFILIFTKKHKFLFLCFTLLIFLIVFFLPILKERALITFTSTGDAQRFHLWKDAFLMIKDNPILGKGVGTFMDNLVKYDVGPGYQYAHNCYLQIWAEAGIFALAGFLWFVFNLFFMGLRMYRKNNNCLILGGLSGILAFLVHSFFDTHLYSLQLAVLFWMFAGLVVAVIRLDSNVNSLAKK